jgi:predicted amidohydrolase
MRAAVVQMCSTDDLAANLKAAEAFVREAADARADLVALPENFAFLRREGQPVPCRQPVDGEIVGRVRAWARELGLWILAGSIPEIVPGDDHRFHNTSVLVSAEGAVEAVYRKIHLFDVDLAAEGGASYRESTHVAPGDEVVVAETPFGALGLSICYDLRFPELYRRMVVEHDARFLAVPSAFTPHTGKDHWEVLLRARAIENQAFVLAPAQAGRHGPDRASYGRSLIVDPWGLVLAQAADRPGVIVADCRIEDLERIRGALPALRHRRV